MKKILSFSFFIILLLSIVGCQKVESHYHTYSPVWEKDDGHHWYKCTYKNCTEFSTKETHNWDEGISTTSPTETGAEEKIFTCTDCGMTKKMTVYEIPDVFGIDFITAIEILEEAGFEVKAVETDVVDISEKLLYPLEIVSKGVVFKIDGYIVDNLGSLNKNYNHFYEGELVSKDKSLMIYYAKEDYIRNKK